MKKLVSLMLAVIICVSFTLPVCAEGGGLFTNERYASTYVCISKSKAIQLQDEFENSSFSGLQELGISSGVAVVAEFVSFGWPGVIIGIGVGASLLLPTAQEHMADELQDIINKMDNDQYVIIEFEEELTYNNWRDAMNGTNVKSRALRDIKAHFITDRYYSQSQLKAFIGIY